MNEGIITVSWTAPNSTNLPCLKASGQRLQKFHEEFHDYRKLYWNKRKIAEEDTIRNLNSSHMQEVEVLRMRLTAKPTTFSAKGHQPLSKDGLNTGHSPCMTCCSLLLAYRFCYCFFLSLNWLCCSMSSSTPSHFPVFPYTHSFHISPPTSHYSMDHIKLIFHWLVWQLCLLYPPSRVSVFLV